MKRNKTIFIGTLAGAFSLLAIYITNIPNSATVTSEPDPSAPQKTSKADKSVSQKFMSNANTHNDSFDSNDKKLPEAASSSVQKGSNPTAFNQYADAKPSAGNDLSLAIQWLSNSEASRVPINDLLSKARIQSRESIKLHPIKNRQEAVTQLNVNVSFADFPSKAFESSDHFFFSAPLTQDFRRGFVISKETGEIATW